MGQLFDLRWVIKEAGVCLDLGRTSDVASICSASSTGRSTKQVIACKAKAVSRTDLRFILNIFAVYKNLNLKVKLKCFPNSNF